MAGYRHFRSLRNMQYDGGRIYTHLEEAENERMHLIACMQIFEASFLEKNASLQRSTLHNSILLVLLSAKPEVSQSIRGISGGARLRNLFYGPSGL